MNYSVFDSLPDMVFVINDERRVVYCNEAAATLCDVTMRRISKQMPFFFELLKFEDPDLFCNPNGTWGRDTPSPMRELSFLTASGKAGTGLLSIQPEPEVAGPEAHWFM